MTNTHIPMTPAAGVKFDTETETAQFALGQHILGSDGTEWVYIQASGAITQYDWVGIDENYQAAALTKDMADDGWHIGVSQIAFTDNYYGWVCVRGSNLTGLLEKACAADVALKTGSAAGTLDDNTSGTKIDGVVAVAKNSLTATAGREVLLTFPRSSTF